MGKKEVFKVPVLGLLIRALGAFPVDRSGGNTGTIKNAIAKLKRGDCLGIFPQGTRCRGREIEETSLNMGAAMISIKAEATVVPVKIVMKDHRYRFLRRITVVVGKPISFAEMAYDKENPGEYARITEMIGKRIAELKA
jgi:1-acyl-sn-glycerol-3-phosphate acyltransferase